VIGRSTGSRNSAIGRICGGSRQSAFAGLGPATRAFPAADGTMLGQPAQLMSGSRCFGFMRSSRQGGRAMAQKTFSDAEVTYWVIPVNDDAFSVEVITEQNHPVTISTFATAVEAKAWIALHRRRVQSEEPWFRASGSRGAGRSKGRTVLA
jgi:hypothetical protein